MNKEVKKQMLQRLTQIREDVERMRGASMVDDLSDISEAEIYSMVTRIRTSIVDITGKNSEYNAQIVDIEKNFYRSKMVVVSMGIVNALIFDIENDYLTKVSELIHANLFSDFLEMGEHLLVEGYKDAAAVITGSTLENHLKKLAQKNGISIDYTNTKGKNRKKSIQTLNEELSKNRVHSKNNQKQVTAWLGIRNSAAHGKYTDYNSNQVDLMIKGIRIFISSFKV